MANDPRSNIWYGSNALTPYTQYGYQKVSGANYAPYGSSVQFVNKNNQVRYVTSTNPNATAVVSAAPSAVENAIVTSSKPINLNGNKVVTVNGQTGVLINEDELANWNGPLPLNQYQINNDPNPQVITKKPNEAVNYVQDVNVRYLKPPTPTPPGEIVITQEPSKVVPPAPPVVIRQQPPRPDTPPPVVIREAPPPPPPPVPRQYLNIPGKIIPPPPRKVIIERLPPLPSKPQIVYIDRWLPYDQCRRRVIYRQLNDIRPNSYQDALNIIRQQPGNYQPTNYPLNQPPLGQPMIVNVQDPQIPPQGPPQGPPPQYYQQDPAALAAAQDPNYAQQRAVVPYNGGQPGYATQQFVNYAAQAPPQQYGPPQGPPQQQYAPPPQQYAPQQGPPPQYQQAPMNQYGQPIYQ